MGADKKGNTDKISHSACYKKGSVSSGPVIITKNTEGLVETNSACNGSSGACAQEYPGSCFLTPTFIQIYSLSYLILTGCWPTVANPIDNRIKSIHIFFIML